jgi:signal transduction histidine kinase
VKTQDVEALQASRKRLLLAADADRRRIERELHQGVQQHLVALAVNLQRAVDLADADPAGTKALLEEMGRDVQRALAETAQLAQRIYPTVHAEGGLGAALRAAAVSAGVAASVDVVVGTTVPPEVATTIYLCCLDVFDNAGPDARPSVTLRDADGELEFDISGVPSMLDLDGLRERVEALGGRLTIRGPRLSLSLPLAR